jgi:hypothetical protein
MRSCRSAAFATSPGMSWIFARAPAVPVWQLIRQRVVHSLCRVESSAADAHDIDTIFFDVNVRHADCAAEGVGLGLTKGKRVRAEGVWSKRSSTAKDGQASHHRRVDGQQARAVQADRDQRSGCRRDAAEATPDELGLNRLHSSRPL